MGYRKTGWMAVLALSASLSVPAEAQSICSDLSDLAVQAREGFSSIRGAPKGPGSLSLTATRVLPGAERCWVRVSKTGDKYAYWCSWRMQPGQLPAGYTKLVNAIRQCYPQADADVDPTTGTDPAATITINGTEFYVSLDANGNTIDFSIDQQ